MTFVLLVEDDIDLAGSLGDFLSESGYEVDFAYNGQMCLKLAQENRYAVIIMDIAMPIMDGITACRELRETYHDSTPILFLTARDTLADKLEGYDAGCDDYLVKPFAAEELVARLGALLKRGRQTADNTQNIGELRIDHLTKRAYRCGNLLELHEIQFRILVELARSAPELVSRHDLESRIWPDALPDSDPLRTHIYRLRQQLDKPYDQDLLITEHGKGYRLVIPK